jgi:hypothetical protein
MVQLPTPSTALPTIVAAAPETTTTVPSTKSAVLDGYNLYVASRSAHTGGGVDGAAYRLRTATDPVDAQVVTVRGVRIGDGTSAVEECVGGTERLVVLKRVGEQWVVFHVLGADQNFEWCK